MDASTPKEPSVRVWVLKNGQIWKCSEMGDASIIQGFEVPYAYFNLRKVIEHPPSYFRHFFWKIEKNRFFSYGRQYA